MPEPLHKEILSQKNGKLWLEEESETAEEWAMGRSENPTTWSGLEPWQNISLAVPTYETKNAPQHGLGSWHMDRKKYTPF